MIQIQNNEIYSDSDKYVHRLGTEQYFRMATTLPDDVVSDFEEVDEIPEYAPPMQIFSGKYYKQNGVLYLCTRDSEQPLTHDLIDLVGTYVETVDEN